MREEGVPRVRRRRAILIIVPVALLLLLYLARAPILEAVARALVHEDEERPADAIVVLAGDGGERTERAVELWRRGLSRSGLLVVAGGPLYHTTTWARLMAAHAEERGVPRARIVLQERSRTTGEDARETAAILEARGVGSIILVTSAWHSARARRRFLEAGGGRLEVISCPVPAPRFPGGWWSDAAAARAVATEALKWVWPGPD